jgi:hypothetical protein
VVVALKLSHQFAIPGIMSEMYSADFEAIDGMSVIRYEARDVPRRLWRAIQMWQYQLVRAQIESSLPADMGEEERGAQLLRASIITGSRDVDEYTRKHVRPNVYRGVNETNRRQLYRRSRVTALFDKQGVFAGSVSTVRNTSPRLPSVAGSIEQKLKMIASPAIPILGGHRYEKVSDVVFIGEPAVALAGLAVALAGNHRDDGVSMYHIADSADQEMAWAIVAGGLQYTSSKPVQDLAGYGETVIDRYEATVGTVVNNILAIPFAETAIDSLVHRTVAPVIYR